MHPLLGRQLLEFRCTSLGLGRLCTGQIPLALEQDSLTEDGLHPLIELPLALKRRCHLTLRFLTHERRPKPLPICLLLRRPARVAAARSTVGAPSSAADDADFA
eukprot:jgi/Chrpa1/23493/Chrysochromulina_OHIO_Genome00004997-RA